MQLHKIWIEQCQAARGIENEFGTLNALKYLVGEKFLNYLQAAEKDADFRAELPSFVAEIKTIFEPWQLSEYLEKAGWTEPFAPAFMRRKRMKTQSSSRWNVKTTCVVLPTKSCCLSGQRNGC